MNHLFFYASILFILSVVFAPPLPGQIGNFIRYDDLIIIFAIIFVMLSLKHRQKGFDKANLIYLVPFILWFGLIINSVLFGNILTQYFDLLGMLKELSRIVKYALVVIIFRHITNDFQQKAVWQTILLAGYITVSIQFLQFFSDASFSHRLADIYGSEIFYYVATSQFERQRGLIWAGATFANKNVTAAFLLIPLAISLWYALIKSRIQSLNKWHLYLAWCGPIILFTGFLLAQSRAGLASAIVVILTCFYFYRKKYSFNLNILSPVLLSLLGLISLKMTTNLQILSIESYLQGMGFEDTVGSLEVKMMLTLQALSMMVEQNAWLGFGPYNPIMLDNEIGYFLIWYGPLGLIVYISLWAAMFQMIQKNRHMSDRWQPLVAIAIGMLVMNISQTTLLSIRVFPIYIAVYMTCFRRYEGYNYIHSTKVNSVIQSSSQYQTKRVAT